VACAKRSRRSRVIMEPMDYRDETRRVNELLVRWNALRMTEVYRRTRFTMQRDAALARWHASGLHRDELANFVDFRVSRGVTALSEAIEIEDHSSVSYAWCREQISTMEHRSEKEKIKLLAAIRDASENAIRRDMRYLATLTSTYQFEVKELEEFIDEQVVDTSG